MSISNLLKTKRFSSRFALLSLTAGLLLSPLRPAAQTTPAAPTIVGSVVTQIAPGGQHSCALTAQGNSQPISIQCWGNNSHGQLGNGTTVNSSTPVSVDPATYTDVSLYDRPIVQLAAGDNHSCALLPATGGVVCWGANASGQLGTGDTTDRSAPVHANGVFGGAAIATGSAHTCVLLAVGTIQCWGDNSHGQLGNGSTGQSGVAVAVLSITKATSISAGGNHTCATLTDGTAQCWGENANGQLGNGATTDASTPVAVKNLSAVKTLTLGQTHTCALLTDATMRCWGNGAQGRLGNGSADSSTPLTVTAVTGTATSITAGSAHTCASFSDGSVQCWGSNQKGQLGSNAAAVSGILVSRNAGSFTTVAAGSTHNCGQDTYGAWKCWGGNDQGQLGNATTQDGILTPMPISGLAARTATVSIGGLSTCFLTQAGTAGLVAGGTTQISSTTFCLGSNDNGQLGNGTRTSSATSNLYPTKVLGLDDAVIKSIDINEFHMCVLLTDGTVRCSGLNDFGQLGDGTTTNRLTPVKVTGVSTATAVSVGSRYSCALLADGTVSCWGWNNSGQLASATLTSSPTPVKIPGITNAVSLITGAATTCVLRSTGAVTCWGYNGNGELGRGTIGGDISAVSVPTDVSGVSGVSAISTELDHTCALLSSGTVSCWGYGPNGQLGDGMAKTTPYPVQVSGLSGVTAISVSASSACAILADQTVRCWGGNLRGPLGDGTQTDRSTPVAVKNLTGVISLTSADEHVCATRASGPIYCWGSDNSGELGPSTSGYASSSQYGNDYYTATPVPIFVGQSLAFTLPATLAPGTTTDLAAVSSASSGLPATFDGWTGIQCELQYNSGNTAISILYTKAPLLCGARATQVGGYNNAQSGSSAPSAGQLRLIQVGTSTPTAPHATLTPNVLGFGSVKVGVTAPAQTTTLTNTGDATLNITSIQITSTNADLFQQTNTCGATLLPNGTCTISVTYTPKTTGDFSAALTITDNAADSPQSAALAGAGISAGTPKAALTPATAAFGNVTVGSTSAAQTFTLTNAGDAALPITSVAISGTNAAAFKFGTNTCGASLSSGSTCTMSITFAPTATGDATASLVVIDSIGTQNAALTGTGTAVPAPKATLTPPDGPFGNVNIGATSAAKAFTLANTGTVDLTITSVSLGGTNAAAFHIASNTCGATLTQGKSCEVDITFQPTASGSASAALSIVDTAGTQSSTLSGTGVTVAAPDFRITSSSSDLSTQRGSSVSSTIQLVSADAANPFTGTATLTATGVPAGVSVTFSPASLTPGTTTATTSTMTITVPATLAKNESTPFRPFGMPSAAASLAGILLLWSLRGRRRLGRLILLAVSFACAVGLTACGDAAPSAPNVITSTVTVTATSGSTTHSTAITLKIN